MSPERQIDPVLLRTRHRTHTCGELRAEHAEHDVTLTGWVDRRREHANVLFIELRDRYGHVQVVVGQESGDAVRQVGDRLTTESTIKVIGRVRLRPEGTKNPSMPTGEVEVVAKEICVLSRAESLPFDVSAVASQKGQKAPTREVRLRHRVLDLRRAEVQNRFIVRHRITAAARRAFDRLGFVEIETPMLTRSTPEGARDYVVPNRRAAGTFYALPQSPQLFKQLLMVAGFDRYYQIVRCFRDEDLRADRQPEFTQLDVEMAFVEPIDVQNVIETVLADIFRDVLHREIALPFPRISYADAMARYGCDKPDLRFELPIVQVAEPLAKSDFNVFTGAIEAGGFVGALCVPGGAARFTRKQLDGLPDVVRDTGAKGVAWCKVEKAGEEPTTASPGGSELRLVGPIAKRVTGEALAGLLSATEAEAGDLLLIVADADTLVAQSALGALRNHLGAELELVKKDAFAFCWVVDFPLFEPDGSPMHHPFTSPVDEDAALLDSEPTKARAKAYDVVLNGLELGGGSIRIHDQALQQKIFDILGIGPALAEEKFGFLLRAFRYGAPPHGGIALGVDRLVRLILGLGDISDVIAFPKTHTGSCLLTGAPAEIDPTQLDELHLNVTKPKPE